MEQDTISDDANIGELSDKDRFLRLYPKSKCVYDYYGVLGGGANPVKFYFIEDWCGTYSSIGHELHLPTEEAAWRIAWETALDIMLCKLES